MPIVIIILGAIVGFAVGALTRPDAGPLGMDIPLSSLSGLSHMDKLGRDIILPHLLTSVAIGVGISLIIVLLIKYLKSGPNKQA